MKRLALLIGFVTLPVLVHCAPMQHFVLGIPEDVWTDKPTQIRTILQGIGKATGTLEESHFETWEHIASGKVFKIGWWARDKFEMWPSAAKRQQIKDTLADAGCKVQMVEGSVPAWLRAQGMKRVEQ